MLPLAARASLGVALASQFAAAHAFSPFLLTSRDNQDGERMAGDKFVRDLDSFGEANVPNQTFAVHDIAGAAAARPKGIFAEEYGVIFLRARANAVQRDDDWACDCFHRGSPWLTRHQRRATQITARADALARQKNTLSVLACILVRSPRLGLIGPAACNLHAL